MSARGVAGFGIRIRRDNNILLTKHCLTLLYSTPPQKDDSTSKQLEEAPHTTCQYCSKSFPSRNSLFQHIRTDPSCSFLDNDDDDDMSVNTSVEFGKQSLAILFGYSDTLASSTTSTDNRGDTTSTTPSTPAITAYSILQNVTLSALQEIAQEHFNVSTSQVKLLSSTQSSIARMRHPSLGQEAGCAAAGDVFVTSLLVPKFMMMMSSVDDNDNDNDNSLLLWKSVIDRMQEKMDDNNSMQLFAVKLLGPELTQRLHAERSCTQRVYHYLLPLSWLPDGEAAKTWWRSGETYVQHTNFVNKVERAPHGLQKFKAMLRKAESAKLTAEEYQLAVDEEEEGNTRSNSNNNRRRRVAKGRFGTFRLQEYRPWHNYADPSLCGDASPNLEVVWKAVDRIRIVGFIEAPTSTNNNNNGDDVIAVVEFKGDDFLNQQVRRVVGSAVAMSHGWLPEDFFEKTIDVEILVDTPVAPSGRLYGAENHFHFEERRTKGRALFDVDTEGPILLKPSTIPDGGGGIKWIQNLLLTKASEASSLLKEEQWLDDLREGVAPRIVKMVASQHDKTLPSTSGSLETACPGVYDTVLKELRDIITSDRWPETSAARATVIRDIKACSNGSFTITNPKSDNVGGTNANKLFPELTAAIFELEEMLSKERRDRINVDKLEPDALEERQSSHCAVNCNAQFTPHVDSGTGSGQSLSMIVGLGDYHGGELLVENNMIDIRYRPIEFDGWKLRHWTSRFQGERFSLVWFTPETKNTFQPIK